MKFAMEVSRRFVLFLIGLVLLPAIAIIPAGHLRAPRASSSQKPAVDAPKKVSPEALRLNTLGVAYMNQGKSADAQKYFEQALAADPDFAQAKMNLGISLLAQQKLEQARAALEQGAGNIPHRAY